jgi:hypothetical protein
MSERCIDTPVSWLRLEQYAVGEMVAAEREHIAAHLEACPACGACFDQIGEHEVKLPSLVEGARAGTADTREPGARPRWFAWGGLGVGLTAAVAALGLFVLRGSDPATSGISVPPNRVTIKGGDVAIELVRQRGTAVRLNAKGYRDGDRFKVLFTCPVAGAMHIDVAVIQDGKVAFPLPAGTSPCGNRVSVPGAFGLTGTNPVTVCVLFDRGGPRQRSAVAPKRLGRAVCASLTAR